MQTSKSNEAELQRRAVARVCVCVWCFSLPLCFLLAVFLPSLLLLLCCGRRSISAQLLLTALSRQTTRSATRRTHGTTNETARHTSKPQSDSARRTNSETQTDAERGKTEQTAERPAHHCTQPPLLTSTHVVCAFVSAPLSLSSSPPADERQWSRGHGPGRRTGCQARTAVAGRSSRGERVARGRRGGGTAKRGCR